MRLSTILAASALMSLSLMSCNRQAKWSVNGTIDGAENAHLKIERAENGMWLTLDTLSTDSKGRFSYKHLPIGYPDIFRLTLDGKSIYFPIDSIESVTINTTADAFASNYSVTGSTLADNMMAIDKIINDRAKTIGSEAAASDSLLKRRLNEMIIANPGAITSYYILLKQIGGNFIYNPGVTADNRIIGAIANAFNESRPNDPRTKFLRDIYMRNRPGRGNGAEQFEITELPYYDIDLMDHTGKHHVLSDIVNNNKVVILNFTAYAADESPAFNIMLADSYRKYHDRGLEIYQVSLDGDEYYWRQTARNLPWVTVYNPMVGESQNLLNLYNVQGLPTTFIFGNGELQQRIDDYSTLDSNIARYF